jgi:uncharacterized membrane protein
MKKGQYAPERLHAFVDAVIAIVLTVLVLELPKPEVASFEALWDLRVYFLAYLISFLEIFFIWRGFFTDFQNIKVVDWKTLYAAGLQLLTISLLPYFTDFVAEHNASIFAEYTFLFMWLLNIGAGYLFYWAVSSANKEFEDEKIDDDLGSDLRDVLGGFFMLLPVLAIPFWPQSGLIGLLVAVIFYSIPESAVPFLGIHVSQILKRVKD